MGNGDAHCVGAAVAPQVGAEIGVRAVPGPPCPRMPHDVPSTGGDRPIPMQGALGRDLCTHISIGICTLSSVGFSLQAPSPRVGDDGEVGRRRTPPPPPERAAEQGPAARVGPSSRGCSFAQRQPGPGLAPGTFPESLQGPGWEKLLSQCGSLLQQSPLPHHPSEIPSGKIITSSIIIHRKPQLPILIRGAGVALRSAGFKDHKRG